ncbi:hypothetical protein MMC30_006731 [Trapelia coarctata]|nr:hypothetical protein [Trapelia coarctata]
MEHLPLKEAFKPIEFHRYHAEPFDGGEYGLLLRAWADRTLLDGESNQKIECARLLKLFAVVTDAVQLVAAAFGKCNPDVIDSTPHISELLLSVQILDHALKAAIGKVYAKLGGVQVPSHKHNSILASHLLRDGWRVHSVRNVWHPQLDIDALGYVLSLEGPQVKKVHSGCTSAMCTANNVDDSYEMQHTEEDCNCDSMEPSKEKVIAILKAGGTPLVRIHRADSGTDHLEVEEYKLGMDYVAVSHLWADGLGNFSGNSLFRCQLASLDRALQDVPDRVGAKQTPEDQTEPRRTNNRFWMDTFCIPTEERHRSLREFAISEMRDIYARASSVLVVDGEVRRLRKHDSPLEIIIRFILSGWEQGLWTLHEGYMAKSINFLAKDGAIIPNSASFTAGPRSEPLQSTIQTQALRKMVLRFFKPNPNILSNILCVLRGRTTSRPKDEAIVIANMLDIKNAPIQALEDADDRMVHLLRQLPEIPLAIVFSRGERLLQPGFRWAPRSLIALVGIMWLALDGTGTLGADTLGLTFDFPSISLSGTPQPGWPLFVVDIAATTQSASVRMGVQYDLDTKSPHWSDAQRTSLKDQVTAILPVILPGNPQSSRGILVELVGLGSQDCALAKYCCCVHTHIWSNNKPNMDLINPEGITRVTLKGQMQSAQRWCMD